MKKLVLFLLLLSFLSSKSQTSVYHPFPDSNAVWNIYCVQWGGCFPISDLYESYSYIIIGDTVINAVTYHKLNIPIVYSNCSGVHSSGYKGCFRQDTIAKKVFFRSPGVSIDTLLYDFNMQIGDTVKGILSSWSGMPDTVQSIDSTLIGTEYRKRWLVNSCYQIYLIEGIGYTYGLLESSPGCVTDAADASITCFKQNGQTLYPDTATSCEVILGIKNTPENNFSISVSPNPFHTSSTFIIKGATKIRNSELKIYNAFGEHVSTKIVIGESATVDRKGLADGIYFYRLVNENKKEVLASGKFVVE